MSWPRDPCHAYVHRVETCSTVLFPEWHRAAESLNCNDVQDIENDLKVPLVPALHRKIGVRQRLGPAPANRDCVAPPESAAWSELGCGLSVLDK